ncbi:hypothetical protein H072_6395 [Dactylellina haptotyla CBS 200.50]|uniref:Phosphoglycerate mutase n=1 Tax=Dactylellina haptotyla (strain CBS 200.50) TaxID=1284197 RepID=S8BWU9_DACHA|nr:hypothetical protein H072_6395 [Dactylellina haptotyla CBS 200.50]
MSDLDAKTPRVFLARHGETEWTKTGQYTGSTDIELTEHGIKQVLSTGSQLVGPGKLIDPVRIAHVWVSPRIRARKTFDLLFRDNTNTNAKYPADSANGNGGQFLEGKVTVTEDIAEWDYGDYEGLLVGEIRAQRKKNGLDQETAWNIWRDGCEGGESAEQITQRLDRLISQIREIQQPCMNGQGPGDVVLVAHGLILRAFMKRWLGYSVDNPLPVMFSPGGIGMLSYKNRDIDEPGFYIGMSLPIQD